MSSGSVTNMHVRSKEYNTYYFIDLTEHKITFKTVHITQQTALSIKAIFSRQVMRIFGNTHRRRPLKLKIESRQLLFVDDIKQE